MNVGLREKLVQWRENPAVIAAIPVLTLFGVIGIVYGDCWNFDFVGWDDDINIYLNPQIRSLSWANVLGYWTNAYEYFYMPVTYTLWSLQAALAPTVPMNAYTESTLDPGTFHGTNLIFHFACSYLVFTILSFLLKKSEVKHWWAGALIASLVYAVHPVQVEAVAWVSGFRDLCCAFFSLACIRLYCAYRDGRPALAYWASFALYVFAILSKPNATSIVPTLVLLDLVIFRGTLKSTAIRCVPHALVAVGLAIVTRAIQGSDLREITSPILMRPLVILDSFGFYLIKLVWPDVFFNYMRTPEYVANHVSTMIVASLPIIGFLFARHAPQPFRRQLLLAALFFASWLLPVSGIFTFISQVQSTTFDRYLYVAIIGPLYLVAWLLARWRGKAVYAASLVALVLLGSKAWLQTKIWRDGYELYLTWIEKVPAGEAGYRNLAIVTIKEHRFYISKKLLDVAIEHSDNAQIPNNEPGVTFANVNVEMMTKVKQMLAAFAEIKAPTFQRAQAQLDVAERVIAERPDEIEAYLSAGYALLQLERFDEATVFYQMLAQKFPDSLTVRNNLGAAYAMRGMLSQAIEQAEWVLARDPDHPAAKAAMERLMSPGVRKVYLNLARVEEHIQKYKGERFPPVRIGTAPYYVEHDFDSQIPSTR